MKLREYYNIVKKHNSKWLLHCVNNPSRWMKKNHIRIIRLVLWERGALVNLIY